MADNNWQNKITTSLFGRRFGLNRVTTGENGGRQAGEFAAGTAAPRVHTSTTESTGTNVSPWGVRKLPGTSAGSSSVYTLDPPVPGVGVTLVGSTLAATYIKTKNSEQIYSALGSSHTVIKMSSAGGAVRLEGYTTGAWACVGITTGSSGTSALFTLSTTT